MARDFDGTDDSIDVTLNADQTSLTQETWVFWIYPDSVAQYRRPLHKGGANQASGRNHTFEMDDGLGFVFAFDWTTASGIWYVAKPSTGSWQHYAVTYDSGSTSNDPNIYKDGTLLSETETSGPVGTRVNTSTALYISSEVSTGQFWDGGIAEVACWSRILTASEISSLAKGFSPLFYPNDLVLYYPLIRDIQDLSGASSQSTTGTTVIAHPRIIYPSSSQLRRFAGAGVAASSGNDWPVFQSRGFRNWRYSG